jgi:type IV pilus biogenesis protein CpaD/CtpE
MKALPMRRTLAAVLAALALAACGSKVTAENFARIQTGMTQQEVVALLGEPTETSAVSIGGLSGGMSTWRDGNTTISVQFLNDKVQAKQLSREAAQSRPK